VSRFQLSFVVLAASLCACAAAANTVERMMTVDGVARSYLLHVPADLDKQRPMPLVLVFHGGGSTPAMMERLTRFSELADRERFIVCYPAGLQRHWNDGRDPKAMGARADVDDVRFVAALIDAIAREQAVDRKRVFATGISNGGFFSHYLGARLSAEIAAIAPVAGGIAERFRPEFHPAVPVSVLVIQGTDDPLVPIGGGEVRGRRGRFVSTDEAIALWLRTDGIAGAPMVKELADTDPRDGCRTTARIWSGGSRGAEVSYYEVTGGGHTWPGGAQYLSRALVGVASNDFNATEVIWQFFKTHPRH
jgi:polyhydroxybutyrate depolymerase